MPVLGLVFINLFRIFKMLRVSLKIVEEKVGRITT